MKKRFIFLCLSIFSFKIQAQIIQSSDNFIELKEVTSNSIKLKNTTNLTIKLKVKNYTGTQYGNYLLKPNYITYPVNFYVDEFSESFVNNLKFEVYYDYECYLTDLAFIEQEKINRIKREENLQNMIGLFRGVSSWLGETTDRTTLLGRATIFSNKMIWLHDAIKTTKENGFTEFLMDEYKSKLKDEAINYTFKNDEIRGIIKGLDSYYSYDQTATVDVSDLNKYAIFLLSKLSDKAIRTYTLSYRDFIQPLVDPDNDGITNKYDKCPNSPGTYKYDGCTKEYLKEQRKSTKQTNRRRDFYSLYLDPAYSYSDIGLLEKDTGSYAKHLVTKGFYGNISIPVLQHNIGKSKGCFMLDANGRMGNTTNKAITITNDNATTTKLKMFQEQTAYAGISYAFMLNRNSSTAFIINPKIGRIIYSKIETKGINFNNIPVEKDAFILNKKNSTYYDLMFRIVFRDGNHYGIHFGAKYINNPEIIKNTKYNYNWKVNGKDFMYPKTSALFYAGLSIIL